MTKYEDIINMERPMPRDVLAKHPRMSTADRAKIFSPFAALKGHDEIEDIYHIYKEEDMV